MSATCEGTPRICETLGCEKDAKLQCPTCIKLNIQGSYFCNQNSTFGHSVNFMQALRNNHKTYHLQIWSTNTSRNVLKKVGLNIKSFIRKQEDAAKEQYEREVAAYNPWPGFKFTGDLRPAPVTPMRKVPDHIPRPDYATHPDGYPTSERAVRGSTNIACLDDEEREGLCVACKLGREVLDIAAEAVEIGVTTEEIDRLVHEACVDRNCYPSPLNYYNFPKSCCTSVNEVICHGIPDARKLQNGDICNVDITVYHRNYHGDLNETFLVGEVEEKYKQLVKVTHECLQNAIAAVKPGLKYREVGNIIQKHAQAHGYSVVKSYCGHGIHKLFHTAPSVPHYAKNKAVGVVKEGHSFTIEPMISEGSWRDITWPDNWTAVTIDGRRSAQFEHTLLVTDSGCEVLTARASGQPWFMDNI